MQMLPDSFAITLTSERLTLVADVGLNHLSALSDLAEAGIHDPDRQPFGNAWTDDPYMRTRLAQYLDGCWDDWAIDDWDCPFTILREGQPIGVQVVSGLGFRLLREVRTGSWLGRGFQGHGYGTEARRMVLDLAFGGLDARYATTSAHADNRAAIAVNRRLGYQWNGTDRKIVRGNPVKELRYRLGRPSYMRHVAPLGRTQVSDLEANREWFGAAA